MGKIWMLNMGQVYMHFNRQGIQRVGGKLGIIKDPFGEAQYLGATQPIEGYGIVNLSLSDDENVLIGQLKGGYSEPYQSNTNPNQNHAWSVAELIKSAQAMPAEDSLTKHITLAALADQLIGSAEASTMDSAPVGTTFDIGHVTVDVEGNMGDIIRVDLKRSVAHALLGLGDELSYLEMMTYSTDISKIMENIKEFKISDGMKNSLTGERMQSTRGMTLVTRNDAAQTIVSDAKGFESSGVMYLAPNLNQGDMDTLRQGGRLTQGKEQFVALKIEWKVDLEVGGLLGFGSVKIKAGPDSINLTVKATDYQATTAPVFFGDRPLDNPGYSAFTLSSEVSVKSGNECLSDAATLDVWRVEQRLKYLGYTAFGVAADQGNPAKPVEFEVDGVFGKNEESALRAFYADTHYTRPYRVDGDTDSGKYGLPTTVTSNEAKKVAPGASNLNDQADDTNWEWLNAYNAPHWVNAYAILGIPQTPLASTADFKDGTQNTMEVYSTSWVADLLKAAQLYRSAQLVDPGNSTDTLNQQYADGTQKRIKLNALAASTDIPGVDGHAAGGHGIGMGIDYGFTGTYIDSDFQIANFDQNPPTIPGSGWSLKNAYDWANLLSPAPAVSGNNQAGALRSFLSLYALTINDGIADNGTWEDLPIKNDAAGSNAVRTALFGSGTQNNLQMLQNIWLGAPGMNTYKGIHAVLNSLGITEVNGVPHAKWPGHQNHFHADMRPPQRIDLPENLTTSQTMLQSQDVAIPMMMLSDKTIAELRQDFGFTEEMNMFVPDMPSVPDQYLPVIVAEARPVAAASASKEMVLGVCRPVPNVLGMEISGEHAINPIPNAIHYLWSFDEYFKQMPEDQRRAALTALASTGKSTILQQPKYGTLTDTAKPDHPVASPNRFFYNPKPGYMGKDQIVFLVEMGEYKIKVINNIYPVAGGAGPEITEKVCGKRGMYFRISSASEQLSSLLGGTNYSSLLSANNGVTLSFADLPSGAVGQTVGTNITLDTNAAGHNWYIDTTPWDNSEYRPTSNPYEWVAKEGTAAYGKMDMLSVLLHEYGHALGIDHSADNHDYMATTLTPGVRRMPSAEEMALMQSLVGQLKGEMVADGSTPTAPPPYPPYQGGGQDGPNPLPIPLGAGFGMAFIGRMRKGSYGSSIDFASGVPLQSTPQYAVAANAIFANLATPAGWNSLGSVNIASGTGSATLNEISTSQTRLSQVFMLNEQDRYLSFTLSGTALDDLNGAPVMLKARHH